MRGLARNTRPIWYATYQGKTEIVDLNGNRTGEYTDSYSDPVRKRMNLAPPQDAADWNPFGIDTPYSIAAMTFEKLPISETSIIWVNREPPEPHDYIVVRVAKSLNNTVYALSEVQDGNTL